jgi:hypothetical protein
VPPPVPVVSSRNATTADMVVAVEVDLVEVEPVVYVVEGQANFWMRSLFLSVT